MSLLGTFLFFHKGLQIPIELPLSLSIFYRFFISITPFLSTLSKKRHKKATDKRKKEPADMRELDLL